MTYNFNYATEQLLKAALRTYNCVQQGLISSTETCGFGDVIFFLSFFFSYLRSQNSDCWNDTKWKLLYEFPWRNRKIYTQKEDKSNELVPSDAKAVRGCWRVCVACFAGSYTLALCLLYNTTYFEPERYSKRQCFKESGRVRDCICFALLSSVSFRIQRVGVELWIILQSSSDSIVSDCCFIVCIYRMEMGDILVKN